MLSHFSCVQFFAILWSVAHQAPLSMGFSRQEYWRGLSFPSPRDRPDPGIKPASRMSSALAGRFFITSTTWEAHRFYWHVLKFTIFQRYWRMMLEEGSGNLPASDMTSLWARFHSAYFHQSYKFQDTNT